MSMLLAILAAVFGIVLLLWAVEVQAAETRACPYCGHDFETCQSGGYAGVFQPCRHVDPTGKCTECTEADTAYCDGCGDTFVEAGMTECNNCGDAYCSDCSDGLNEQGLCPDCSG